MVTVVSPPEIIHAGGGTGLPVFTISLAGKVLGPYGYFVLVHDGLVPGAPTDPNDWYPTLEISDPSNLYTSLGVILQCGGTTLDTVCCRGNALSECEGPAAVDVPGESIGRGHHIDTDNNYQDFLLQLEPSPWMGNLNEVR